MRAEFCIFESNAPGLKANFYEPYVDKPIPEASTVLPFYHPISTVGLLILILDLLLFPPPLLPDLSSHLTYSLLFYLSYMEQVFFIPFTVPLFIFLLLETPSTRV